MPKVRRRLLAGLLPSLLTCLTASRLDAGPQYVIDISVDGLGSAYLSALMDIQQLPNFRRLELEGASTRNARNDYENTVTLPNHSTMLTGRGVAGSLGHNYTDDGTPPADTTLHSNKGGYVASVFDVAHDHGLQTALFANKSKFVLFQRSYDAGHGAPDVTGVDNGSGKIDRYTYYHDSSPLVSSYLDFMAATPPQYSFLHLRDPDDAGHGTSSTGGWGNTDYLQAVRTVDAYLGKVLDLVSASPTLRGNTTVIVTADHGGRSTSHSTVDQPLNYTIPFYAWGAGVAPGTDLYSLNAASRRDPGTGRPDYGGAREPIRNGDIANLSLSLLGLPAVPGSTINAGQDLAIQGEGAPPPVFLAGTCFLQSPSGAKSWSPGPGQVELGFFTASTPQGGVSPLAAVYNSSASPCRFRTQSAVAETTFAAIDLRRSQDVTCEIDVMLKNVTYDSSDFFKATLTDGVETITLADVSGSALNSLAKNTWVHYSAAVPPTWATATLQFSSGSVADAAPVDLDHVEFHAARVTPASGVWQASGGSWSDAASWSGGMPLREGDTATLGSTGPLPVSVSLGGTRTLSGLVFINAASITLTGGAGDTLVLSNRLNPVPVSVEGPAGAHEIATAVLLVDGMGVNVNAGGELMISGQVMGFGAIRKTGEGTLVLSGANEYAGGTAVEAGVLQVDTPASLPPGGSLTVGGGGTVILDSGLSTEVGPAAVSISGGSLLPASTAVPEPGTAMLVTAAWFAWLALSLKTRLLVARVAAGWSVSSGSRAAATRRPRAPGERFRPRPSREGGCRSWRRLDYTLAADSRPPGLAESTRRNWRGSHGGEARSP